MTDAARALKVAPSTAHRLLSTLVGRAFAVQDHRRRYAAGPALLAPGQARPTPSVPERVRPYLEQLFDATQETCHVMVRVGAQVRFVDGVEGTQSLRVGLRTGVRMPAHTTSGGKAMLAELDPQVIAALEHDDPSPAAGGALPDILSRQAASVRGHRLGLNRDESEPGVTALGASIGVVDGHHTALSIAVPTARLTAETAQELSRLLLRICQDARRALAKA